MDYQSYKEFQTKQDKINLQDVQERVKVTFMPKDAYSYENVVVVKRVPEDEIDDFGFVSGRCPIPSNSLLSPSPSLSPPLP
jgi:hypothetical protein